MTMYVDMLVIWEWKLKKNKRLLGFSLLSYMRNLLANIELSAWEVERFSLSRYLKLKKIISNQNKNKSNNLLTHTNKQHQPTHKPFSPN
jgi:hypothetical protein